MNLKNLISVNLTKLLLLNIFVLIAVLWVVGCQSSSRFSAGKNVKVKQEGKDTVIKNPKPVEKTSTNQIQFESTNPTRQFLINTAMSYLGTSYCYGGEGDENCFDCSGFVNEVYQSVGILLPRISSDIYQQGTEVDRFSAEAGDLVFFSKSSRINHVGMYLGQNSMIHASTSKGVIIQSIDDSYFKSNLAGFRRYLK